VSARCDAAPGAMPAGRRTPPAGRVLSPTCTFCASLRPVMLSVSDDLAPHLRWSAPMFNRTTSWLQHVLLTAAGRRRRPGQLLLASLACAPLWMACTPRSSGVPSSRDDARGDMAVQDEADPYAEQRGREGNYRVQSYTSGTPTELVVRVEAFPHEGTAADGLLRGCPVEVLLKPAAGGREPVWRSPAVPGPTCAGAKRTIESAGSVLELRYDLRRVLGDSLAPGAYDVLTMVGSDRDPLRFRNGGVYLWPDTLPPIPSLAPLRFAAVARVQGGAPADLLVEVTATNTGRRRVEVGFGACAVRVALYKPAASSDGALWDSSVAEACPAYSAGAVLAPGESRQPGEFRTEIAMGRIRAAGVPPGVYDGVATLRLSGGRNETADDSVRLPLGRITVP
jgi:hypothetical protein